MQQLQLLGRPGVAAKRAASFDALVAPFAHALFARKRVVALLIIGAVATEPRALVLGLASLLAALATMRLVGVKANAMSSSHYAYNALLVGLALSQDVGLGLRACAVAACLGVCAVFVTAALCSLFGLAGWVPLLNFPFVVTAYLSVGLHQYLGLTGATPLHDPVTGWLLPAVALPLQSLGALVFVPTALAGCLIFAALLVHSRIAATLALASALLVHALAALVHAPLSQLVELAVTSNAILTAVAIGGVWFVPSRGSFALASLAAALAAFFALGLYLPLERLGLPVSFLPFDLSMVLILSAMLQRVPNQSPVLSQVVAADPEELLLHHASRRAISSDPHAPRFSLPFLGIWTCTQGADGVFTHQGSLRHAYDFEVYGDRDGALCTRSGANVEDYYCYGLPVLAAADGTVVAVEMDVEDNAIGSVHRDKHWGNFVTVQHSATVYSVVGHLAPRSACVYPGQYVRRGTLLGYCGNSGRSPRPHLHFQLQSGPNLGSPTLPCRFSSAIARTGEALSFAADHEPVEGQALRNLEPDHTLGAFFDLPFGQTLTYRSGPEVEEVECGVDLWGRPQLRSRDFGTTLLHSRDESCFTTADLLGARRSVLRLWRVSMARVPLEQLDGLSFSEWLPGRWVSGPLRALAWDVLAPFSSSPGMELTYRASLEHGRLVIVGSSRAQDAAGRPLVSTRAELVRGAGPLSFELRVGNHTQRAERILSAQESTRSEVPEVEPAGLSASSSYLAIGEQS